jgi:hypothetical protein
MARWLRLFIGLLTLALVVLGGSQLRAEELFGNPFASVEELRKLQRDPTSGAPLRPGGQLRVRYQVSGDGQQPGELVIDVASDWGLVQRGDRRTFYDFLLGRIFDLRDDGTFVSRNMLSSVAFRVFERQNRAALTHVLRGAGAADAMDACDAETELGVAIPMSKERGVVAIKQSGATTTLECDGRVVGSLEEGLGDRAPAALWPVLARETTMHPALQARLSTGGPAPRRLEAFFKIASDRKALSWRLVSAERSLIMMPNPLAGNLINTTAASINEAVAPGLGDVAAEAIAGRALGGPPTLASWDTEVARVAKEKGAAAAVLAMWPALNMFPVPLPQSCQSGAKSAICDNLRNLAATAAKDAAVQALLDITKAEQMRRPADAIAAMVAARASPHSDHPVLGASFALALQERRRRDAHSGRG